MAVRYLFSKYKLHSRCVNIVTVKYNKKTSATDTVLVPWRMRLFMDNLFS